MAGKNLQKKRRNGSHREQDIYDAAMFLPAEYRKRLEKHIIKSAGTFVWKMQNFPRFVPRQALARFLCRSEMFKKVLTIQGSIVECGVLGGFGLTTWAQLSAIYEPLNAQRKIIGFDTFSGFPNVSEKDCTRDNPFMHAGGLAIDAYKELQETIALYDKNRFLGHISKVELIRGDMITTVPKYLEDHPATIISLIYCDVDIYEPTRVALEHLVPRMPKGAIIAFDELNDDSWPGETLALIDTLGIRNTKLERFSYDTKISYAVLG